MPPRCDIGRWHPQELPHLLSHAENHATFDPRASSTFVNNGRTYTLSYGSGSLTVQLGYDTLKVGTALLRRSSPMERAWGVAFGQVSCLL